MVLVPGLEDGLEVTIDCDKARLTEYRHTIEGNSASCWVPSEENKAFHVAFRNNSKDTILKAKIFLDGASVPAHSPVLHPGKCYTSKGIRSDGNMVQPYKFSTLQVSEDDGAEAENDDGDVEDVGSLTIRIRRCESTGEVRPNSIPAEKYGRSHSGKISERSKKHGYHFVSLGAGIKLRDQVSDSHNTYQIIPGSSVHEVIFYYAPLAVLQARGIIPLPIGAVSPKVEKRTPKLRPRLIIISDDEDDDIIILKPRKRVKLEKDECSMPPNTLPDKKEVQSTSKDSPNRSN